MKVAILGGGFAGLAAAYDANKNGHEVIIFEKNPELGGLAAGFKPDHWQWPLERAYHHLFANDTDILKLAEDTGFSGIYFKTPKTDSLYRVKDNYRIFPVDSPLDFLRFPLVSYPNKLRAGLSLALLRYGPHLRLYDQISAEQFIKTTMGEQMWRIFWEQLLRKKFGKYAGNIATSFIWGRLSKRTKQLGYITHGFQSFIDHLAHDLKNGGVVIRKKTTVQRIEHHEKTFTIHTNTKKELFDAVISTLPTPVLLRVAGEMFPKTFTDPLHKLKYLSALVLVLETKKPILEKTYWLNICAAELPLMFVGQHTNFVSPDHYGGLPISYVGYYLEDSDPLLKKTDEELLAYVLPSLNKVAGRTVTVEHKYIWKAPFAQPLFTTDFIKNIPPMQTPVHNFYIANLDMTFPYDRGTNYAVALGRKAAALLEQ